MSFVWGPLLLGGAQILAATAYVRAAEMAGTGAVATLRHRGAVRTAAAQGAGSLATAATLAAVRVAAASASSALAAVGTYASGSAPPPRPWYQIRRRPGFDGIMDAWAEEQRLDPLRPPPRVNGIVGR